MGFELLADALNARLRQVSTDTDCFRVLDHRDGELVVDTFAGHWLASGFGPQCPQSLVEAVTEIPEARSLSWKQLDLNQKEAPELILGEGPSKPFLIQETGVRYRIDFDAGYSQGLFLDQRENRAEVAHRAQGGKRVLNLFAYTCGFSVTAAVSGGISTSLDLSGPYLEWGKQNFRANEIEPGEHFFCKGDASDWLRRFAKSGRSFDGVVLDPPTFSRAGKKKVFRVEKDYDELVALATRVTEPGGWILATTNCRRLPLDDFHVLVSDGLDQADRRGEIESRAMPFDFDESDYLKTLWVDLA